MRDPDRNIVAKPRGDKAEENVAMPTVWIPALLRSLTAGHDQVCATGATLAEIVADLDRNYPGLRERLCDGAKIRSGLAVVVDGNVARLGLDQPVADDNEIHFVQAIGGGCEVLDGERGA